MIGPAIPIERRRTAEYPTRYSAFGNPGALYVYVPTDGSDPLRGEVAAYSAPIPNAHYKHLVDGVDAEVYAVFRRDGVQLCAKVHASRPDASRHQRNTSRNFDATDVAGALSWLETEIGAAHAWLGRPTHDVLRESAEDERREAAAIAGTDATQVVRRLGCLARAERLDADAERFAAAGGAS